MRVNNKQMTQFLQVNNLNGTSQMHRVGRSIWKKTIKLNPTAETNEKGWARYGLDIKPLMNKDTQGLYRLKLSFNRKHINYPCAAAPGEEEKTNPFKAPIKRKRPASGTTLAMRTWAERLLPKRHNPCHPVITAAATTTAWRNTAMFW